MASPHSRDVYKRQKQPFPVAWAGKPEEQLRQISGLGLRFCHPSRCLLYTSLNPGSTSIPKENSAHGYMTLKDGVFTWKTLDGEKYHEVKV